MHVFIKAFILISISFCLSLYIELHAVKENIKFIRKLYILYWLNQYFKNSYKKKNISFKIELCSKLNFSSVIEFKTILKFKAK